MYLINIILFQKNWNCNGDKRGRGLNEVQQKEKKISNQQRQKKTGVYNNHMKQQ